MKSIVNSFKPIVLCSNVLYNTEPHKSKIVSSVSEDKDDKYLTCKIEVTGLGSNSILSIDNILIPVLVVSSINSSTSKTNSIKRVAVSHSFLMIIA